MAERTTPLFVLSYEYKEQTQLKIAGPIPPQMKTHFHNTDNQEGGAGRKKPKSNPKEKETSDGLGTNVG